MSAGEMWEKGMDVWMSIGGDKSNLQTWSQANRRQLLEAYAYFKRAYDEFKKEPMFLAQMARLSFDLLDNEQAVWYAKQAIALDPNEIDAHYCLFMISVNAYLKQKYAIITFGGLVGLIMSAFKFANVQSARSTLGKTSQTFLNAVKESLSQATPNDENLQAIAEMLTDSAQMLSEFGFNSDDYLQLVVDEYTRLQAKATGESKDVLFRCVAQAEGLLRFR